ncbi:hypothetical protein M8J77_001409 [Diaphorina citri]|nr:hypothetical protein M8J77_001409 [Diaphorina citri]
MLEPPYPPSLMAKFARSYSKYAVFGIGAVAGGTIIEISRKYYHSHLAHSSWTTNYEPSGTKWDSNWDRREGEYLVHPKKRSIVPEGLDLLKGTKDEKPVQSKAVRNIFMIRHGQYNLDGKTDAERVLTPLGRSQALATGKRLKVLDYPFNKIHVSTMSRAIETAQLISQSLPDVPVEQCALLEEGAPVPPDPPVGHWQPEVHFFQDGPRIEAAFRNFFHRADPSQEHDSYELLVCHANVIRYFVCRSMQFPAEAWLRFSLYHASITWLQIYPNGRVTLRIYGDVGHMNPDKMTNMNYSKKRDRSQLKHHTTHYLPTCILYYLDPQDETCVDHHNSWLVTQQ